MSKINVLPKQVSELIAAGEVVERPSSVIKELVENSIDAGSTLITVEIKNGGVTFMRVTDNGCGIEREDVTTAFKRHATSKVKTEDDLNGIATLGFRGEALAAISSVSHVEMITKTRDSEIGTSYSSTGAEGVTVNDAGCPDGTTVIIRDLFYNTPARMKFLKKDVAEGNSVGAILDHIALSHPEISIRFIRDGKSVFTTPGDGKLISAIYAVCGREFALTLIPVDGELGGIRISGYVCRPTACRPKKNSQFVFLNGRYVRSGTVSSALDAAYKNMAMVGRYPAAVLHLTVPYSAVDINVHPAKTEVRFSDERRIFECVMYSVKNALAGNDERPEMRLSQTKGQIRMTADEYRQTVLPGIEKKKEYPLSAYQKMILNAEKAARPNVLSNNRVSTGYSYNTVKPAESVLQNNRQENIENKKDDYFSWLDEEKVTTEKTKNEEYELGSVEVKKVDIMSQSSKSINETVLAEDGQEAALPITPKVMPSAEATEENETLTEAIEYIGEAFSTYIIVRRKESLYLIDKHAAHERMLFNKLRSTEQNDPQLLLAPMRVVLPKDEYTVIIEGVELLLKAGFELEDFGDSTVLVRAVPAMLASESIDGLLSEIAASLKEKNCVEIEKLERIYETIACRSAVKAGNFSSKEELETLANTVLSTKELMYCPHGRPVAIELKKREIEKQFGRIQ